MCLSQPFASHDILITAWKLKRFFLKANRSSKLHIHNTQATCNQPDFSHRQMCLARSHTLTENSKCSIISLMLPGTHNNNSTFFRDQLTAIAVPQTIPKYHSDDCVSSKMEILNLVDLEVKEIFLKSKKIVFLFVRIEYVNAYDEATAM